MKNALLHKKRAADGIKNFCRDFFGLCTKAEEAAKILLKLSVTMFFGLIAAGLAIIIFPSMAEPAGVEYVTDMIFQTAQKILLLGVILAASADFILTDRDKNND